MSFYRVKQDFFKDGDNQKVCELRYKNYMQRYKATYKSVIDEKKQVSMRSRIGGSQ